MAGNPVIPEDHPVAHRKVGDKMPFHIEAVAKFIDCQRG